MTQLSDHALLTIHSEMSGAIGGHEKRTFFRKIWISVLLELAAMVSFLNAFNAPPIEPILIAMQLACAAAGIGISLDATKWLRRQLVDRRISLALNSYPEQSNELRKCIFLQDLLQVVPTLQICDVISKLAAGMIGVSSLLLIVSRQSSGFGVLTFLGLLVTVLAQLLTLSSVSGSKSFRLI